MNQPEEQPKNCRPKYWNELDEKGKIERLREQVKAQDRLIDRLSVLISRLDRHLHVGEHIVTPISNTLYEGEPYQKTGKSDEYF